MPWTKTRYPDSMKNLPAPVRNKAIEIANALLKDEGMEEGYAIATATSRAKDWAENHGKKSDSKKIQRKTDVKKHGEDRYVIPAEDNTWAVKEEGAKRVEKKFKSKEEASRKAKKEAKENNASVTIQRKDGKVQKRISYNPNRRYRKLTTRSKRRSTSKK